MTTIKQLQKKLREAEREIGDMERSRDSLLRECERLEEQRDALAAHKESEELRLYALYDSFMQERIDLQSRMLRIDQRIMALGIKAPIPSYSASANERERRAKE
jgi:hypothetical protein